MSKIRYKLIPVRLDVPIYGVMGRAPKPKQVPENTKGHPRVLEKHGRFTKYTKLK